MPKLHLTDLSLRSLKPGMYWDTTVPAIGIRVQKHRRTFLVMMGPQRKRIPLGHWPQTKLADARTSARRILYTDEQPATTSLSMRSAFDKYFETVRLSPRWEREQRRLITKHFLEANGVKYEDVKVSFVGYSDSVNQMKDGHAVAFGLNTQAPAGAVMDLAAAHSPASATANAVTPAAATSQSVARLARLMR